MANDKCPRCGAWMRPTEKGAVCSRIVLFTLSRPPRPKAKRSNPVGHGDLPGDFPAIPDEAAFQIELAKQAKPKAQE